MVLQIFLYDQAAQRMPDEHWFGAERVDSALHVVDMVGEGGRAEWFRRGARSVAAQAHSGRAEALVREEVQEVLVPAPCGMPCSMNE